MKPVNSPESRLMDRRLFLGLGMGSLALWAGCKSPLTRGQTPEQDDLKGEEEVKEKRDLVGSYTRPFGLNKVKLEAVGLVVRRCQVVRVVVARRCQVVAVVRRCPAVAVAGPPSCQALRKYQA